MRRGMRRIFRFWAGLEAENFRRGIKAAGRRAIASVDPAGDFLGKSAERGPPARAGDFDGAVLPDLGGRRLAGINCCRSEAWIAIPRSGDGAGSMIQSDTGISMIAALL